jgi:hypothetical protein
MQPEDPVHNTDTNNFYCLFVYFFSSFCVQKLKKIGLWYTSKQYLPSAVYCPVTKIVRTFCGVCNRDLWHYEFMNMPMERINGRTWNCESSNFIPHVMCVIDCFRGFHLWTWNLLCLRNYPTDRVMCGYVHWLKSEKGGYFRCVMIRAQLRL